MPSRSLPSEEITSTLTQVSQPQAQERCTSSAGMRRVWTIEPENIVMLGVDKGDAWGIMCSMVASNGGNAMAPDHTHLSVESAAHCGNSGCRAVAREPVAHAIKLRRITITTLRHAMRLTGHCEGCGTATDTVAFWDGGQYAEICAACAAESNRRVGDDAA